jgi:uncharacterized protein YybS (DUF2232 family)
MSQRRTPARAIHRAFAAEPGRSAAGQHTRGLTEGAILAALAAVIAAAGVVVPPVAILLAPVPVMLLVIRWGLRTGVLATVVAGLILLQFFGPLVAFSAIVFGPVGLALGWGVRNERGATWTVLAGAAAFCASMLASLALAAAVLHQDVIGQLIRLQIDSMRQSASLLERMGAPAQNVEPLHLLIDAPCGEHHCFAPPLETLIRSTSLVIVTLGALLWGYLCYAVARSLLRRLGYQVPAVPPMLTWRLPRRLAAALVWISGGLSLAGLGVPALSGLVLSAVFLNLFVFGFLGALVAVTWMTRRQIPRLAQAAVLLLLITSQSTLPLLALAVIGMLDTWHDYRRLTTRSAPPPAARDDPDRPAGQGAALPDAVDAGEDRTQQPKAVSRP